MPPTCREAAQANPHRRVGCRTRMRLPCFSLSLLAVAVAVLPACSSSASDAGFTVSDSAGIRIARNASLPARVDSLPQPAVRIGSADAGGAAEYSFDYVSDVDALPDGRIVVVDNRGARVALFDSAGTWLRDLGRSGGGPGEYRTPLSLHWRGDTLLVWDMIQRRFSAWLGDSLAGMMPLAIPRRPSRLALTADAVILERETGQQTDPAPAQGRIERIALASGDTTARVLVGPYPVPEYGWTISDPATGSGMMVNPPTFSARPRWTVAGNRLVWTSGADARIEIRDSTGALQQIIHGAHPVRPVTDAERDAYFTGMQRRFGMSDADVARSRTAATFAASLPVYVGVVVDDEAHIWAALHDPATFEGTGTTWAVFDPSGRHVRTVVFNERFALQRVRNGRAYGITTSNDGAHTVDVYRLQ